MTPAFRSRPLALLCGASVALFISTGSAEPIRFLQHANEPDRAALLEMALTPPATPAQTKKSAGPAAKPAQLNDLAWLSGRWVGKWGPRTAEEVWTSPQAGLMLGAFRLFEDNHTLLVEVFTLQQKAQGVELRFRHFTPDLVPWEGSAATQLSLESYDSAKWVFLNDGDGQPKRSIIIRVDADTYMLRSEISAGPGPMRVVDLTFHRQPSAARKPRTQ